MRKSDDSQKLPIKSQTVSTDLKTVAIIFSKERAMQWDASIRTFALIRGQWCFRVYAAFWRGWSRLRKVLGEWIHFLHGTPNIRLQSTQSSYCLDEQSVLRGGQFRFKGWIALKKTHAPAKVRAEIFTLGRRSILSAEVRMQPGVSPHSPAGSPAEATGFEIRGQLYRKLTFITLEYFCDGKWLTFARFITLPRHPED